MRVIKIVKLGKSTVVEINDGLAPAIVHVFNKPTNLGLRNNAIQVYCDEIKLIIQYDELFNKLGSTTIRGYVDAAATANLFNQ